MPNRNPKLLIFVGMVEEDLVAFRVVVSQKDPNQLALEILPLEHVQAKAIRKLTSHVGGDRLLLASATVEGRVTVADLEDRKCWQVTLPGEESVSDLAFSACGRYLFVAGFERNLYYVGVREQAVVCRKGNVASTPLMAVRVRPPVGRLMFTLEQNRGLRRWDLYENATMSSDALKADERFEGPILRMEFSPSGNQLATAGYNFTKVISMVDGTEIRAVKFTGKSMAIVWLSESVLAIGTYSGDIITFAIDDQREPDLTRVYDDGSKLKAMARAGNYVATVSNATELILWEILEGYQFWPVCRTYISGRASAVVMMDGIAKVLDPEPVPGCSKQASPTDSRDNTAKDAAPEPVPDSKNNEFGDTSPESPIELDISTSDA